MAKKLDGKTALVTGASSGIGEATAVALAAEGARVAVAARRLDRLARLVERITKAGGEASVVEADVADQARAEQMVAAVEQRYGRIDVLVNNAGVMLLAPVDSADPADWRSMFDVNVLGLMYVTRAALPAMRKRGSGHIVNLSSVAGRKAFATMGAYSASKFAVRAFSESLRQEVFRDKIRVTVVEPGVVATELIGHITHGATKERIDAWARSMRQLQPDDIAAAIVYAVTQPDRVNVDEVLLRPTDQEM